MKYSKLRQIDRKWSEIGAALGLLFGFTGFIALVGPYIPGLMGFEQLLLAIALLAIPGWVLKRAPITIDDLGVRFGPIGQTLGLWLLASLCVYPLFIAGTHLLQTELLEHPSDWDAAHLLRWSEDLEGAPQNACAADRSATLAWVDSQGLWVLGPPGQRTHLDPGQTSSQLQRVFCRQGRPARSGAPLGKTPRLVAADGEGFWLDLRGKDNFKVDLKVDGIALPKEMLLTGAHRAQASTTGSVGDSRSLWWILSFIIVHLGLVAIPEEWFFRGYLQPRLDQHLGTPMRLWGAQIGWGLVLSALAFALLHPILVPGAHRLLVFFPALLFGWLRARQGGIGAAVLMHASANLVAAIISRMY